MKRLSLIMMSVALVLGMAQCKKNVEPVATTTSGTMNITLDVDGGSKVSVTPSTGVVRFQTGDKIYVASHGKYVGTLTHNGSNFTGNISGATADEPLYFYFMGNKTPTGTLTAGTTASIAVSIYDQTSEFPVISAAPSNENFSESTYTYTATLLNKCALVKFNVTTPSSAPIIITGVNDVVTVTFSSSGVGTFVSSQSKGAIKMAKDGNNEYWAILAGDQGNVAANGVAYSADLMYNGTCGAISGISNNGYLDSGITVTVSTEMPKFSVSEDTQVRFAPGNLQYIGSATTPYWKFADNQYDIIGGSTGSGQFSDATDVDRDLFGWGTSGWSGSGATYYQPYDTYNSVSLYGPSGATTLTGTYANADWGVYNSSNISNGYGSSWYTLGSWAYVLNGRTGLSTIGGTENASYGICTVNSRYGLMIFPDDFTWPESVSEPTANLNGTTGDASIGTYTVAQWTLLEVNGAVILPGCGYRNGTTAENVGNRGEYWSATSAASGEANRLYFGNWGAWYPDTRSGRSCGFGVRLVRE